ncbi:methyltransferase domain-containing protein [Streptomyces sp. TRM 70351]|uniref:methyltransferase domain-containing protein n=1 Tax=Streptomyces sp. TRM 70351 TaxID=3116552 RepID=UPI002E7C5543|nr:methyltransferase domain-containing protein [Streptomyces sp. TRM 70351]MEE1927421.1 methyltransferase domain-containing protein [Streptomyces sp. TRM 70351]
MASTEDLREQAAQAMADGGRWPADSPWVRQAMQALPRDRYAPGRLWRWTGDAYVPVDRAADPRGWAAEVYGGPGVAAVTQVTDGRASSSLSAPAVVADMLDAVMLEPGQRVLELGTGTGWNAALLAWRAGSGRVVSVETDSRLALAARERLDAAGAEVAVEVADGQAGWPAGAPYDRVIATYAVEEVPAAWVTQTRPGGRIVTPWGRLGHVALTVAADGRSATGWMQGLAMFMSARGAAPALGWRQVRGDAPPRRERRLTRDLRPLRDSADLLFAVRVVLPDVQVLTRTEGDQVTVWLHDGVSSWATLVGSHAVVYGGGPRDLAAELDQAWEWWLRRGSPGLYDFGMTVAVEPHSQVVWCGNPHAGPYWPGPRPGAAARS